MPDQVGTTSINPLTIQSAGASGQVLADFRALAEATTLDGSPRYALRPALNWPARVIVGREGGVLLFASFLDLCNRATILLQNNEISG